MVGLNPFEKGSYHFLWGASLTNSPGHGGSLCKSDVSHIEGTRPAI